jgi:hypothetical protein
MIEFFAGLEFEYILSGIVLGAVAYYPAPRLFQFLKEQLNIGGEHARAFVAVLSFVLSAFFMWATGALDLEVEFNLANIIAVASAVYAVSGKYYREYIQE